MAAASDKLVIAHRGASAYLPEHTLVGKSLAHGLGADYIEQDVVLTKDDQPIVLHDIFLDAVTDVAQKFPARRRADGYHYAIDLTLDEIKTLVVCERVDLQRGRVLYPGRFPAGFTAGLEISTLAEEIQLIQGLNQSTGRRVGIYPEIKHPAWHRAQGKDIGQVVLTMLHKFGYRRQSDLAFLQCFDPLELQRLRHELDCELRLVQLVGAATGRSVAGDFEPLPSARDLEQIAAYAAAIGSRLPDVEFEHDAEGETQISRLVRDAHRCGLIVHPYTLRADQLPDYVDSFDELLDRVLVEADADGVFTDFPDRVRHYLDAIPHDRAE